MRFLVIFALLFSLSVNAQEAPETAITPEERLELAQVAFRTGDFNQIRSYIEPLLVPEPTIEPKEARIEARQLLGVAYFYEAQDATTPLQKEELVVAAKYQFLELLRESPDHQLDQMLYPASVAELFERVRAENKAELDSLRPNTDTQTQEPSVQTFYVERRVESRNFALNFAPFGLGQWQNNQQVKATFFGVTQALALGLNVTSYIIIESLRGEDGYYNPGPDRRSGDFQDALAWRNVMYGSAITFVTLWAASIIDGVMNFEETDITIRALDAPPPELLPPREGSSLWTGAPIGWELVFPF